MQDQFDNSANDQNESNEAPDKGPVTKAELELLESQREKPTYAPKLTIGGDIEKSVHEDIAKAREDRISHIQQRLDGAGQRFEKDFEKSR